MSQAVQVIVEPLNQNGLSDYVFTDCYGEFHQYSRKQAGELLGDLDEAERQLRKYYPNARYNNQLVEGFITEARITRDVRRDAPSVRALKSRPYQMFGYKVNPLSGHISGGSYNTGFTKLRAWEFSLWTTAGIPTWYTSTYIETAKLLVCHHNSAMKPEEEHHTFSRYIRPHIQLKQHNPFVYALMGLSHAYGLNIGEEKAQALWDVGFHSLLDLAESSKSEIMLAAGIGDKVAGNLMKAIGRL